MVGHPRPLNNVRPEFGDSLASEQPGAIPVLDGPPSASELPVDTNDEPAGLIYINQSTEAVEVAVPNGSGGVTTNALLDVSASVDLGLGDLTGLL